MTPDGTRFRCADDMVMGGEAGTGQENTSSISSIRSMRGGHAAGMMDVGRGGVWSTSAGRWDYWFRVNGECRCLKEVRPHILSKQIHGVL